MVCSVLVRRPVDTAQGRGTIADGDHADCKNGNAKAESAFPARKDSIRFASFVGGIHRIVTSTGIVQTPPTSASGTAHT
ncbi:hypothetical protein [Caballeronia ptereochthonis]|uniref:hypothetical protein n=1 Tax=Caballeronia ptereochthonis TaxID=1777144 RepID=UPI000B2A14B2|nr:hypothetical protein [Caballeronia ptereochthonis]